MTALAFRVLIRLLNAFPYSTISRLGKLVGGLLSCIPNNLKRVTRANLSACFPELDDSAISQLTRESLDQLGRFVAEAGLAWAAEDARWRNAIVQIDGENEIADPVRQGRGVLLLVPHYGNWEILNLYLGTRYELWVIYERVRLESLEPMVAAARARTGSHVVPISITGLRAIRSALARGEVAALLPDQVPRPDSGEYVPFLGRPALTASLPYKLIERARPVVLIGYAQRLPGASGFRIAFERLPELEQARDVKTGLAELNAAIERLVRSDPTQYQWHYKRFRRPPPGTPRLY